MSTVDKIMSEAQVFASAWSLVGGRFDDGSGIEHAEECKAALRDLIAAALAEARREGAQGRPDGWRRFPQELPPSIGSGGFSPVLWIAFEDGGVELGRCLRRPPSSTHDQPVHAWFADGAQIAASRTVVAWRPLVAPTHPGATP